MNTWPVQDAKARFSELLDSCLEEGPQMVSRRGCNTAVLISVEEWNRLNAGKKPGLKALLLAPSFGEIELPERGKAKRRKSETVGIIFCREIKMYLVDTNVISELRKAKPHGGVMAWVNQVDEKDLFISVVTLGEIQKGIEKTRMQDKPKALAFDHWLDQIAEEYNILPMTEKTFRLWAKLMHGLTDDLYEDAMIVATAIEHQLVVVTRNVRDFSAFNIKILNPFEFK